MAKRPPRAERLQVPGPAGALEALIESPESLEARLPDASFGVICHPHPLYGGSLDNKVVHTLARSFQELGVATVRFNFRGVGTSEGGFADGLGETDDALAVVAYGRERWPGANLWLAGFSFGGAVAIRAAATANPASLITVAPAIERVDMSGIVAPQCPWLIVHGEADALVDPSHVLEWAARLTPRPNVALLPGVDHFFHGRLHELRDAVTAFLKQKPG